MTKDQFDRLVVAAARVGGQVRILDIRLRDVSASLRQPTPETPIELDLNAALSLTRVDDLVVYSIKYKVDAKAADGEPAFDGAIIFSVIYGFEDDAPEFSDEELQAFGETSVLFTVHPYLRELLQTMTGRMGLPPLILDLMQSPLDLVMSPQVVE